jgi:hypothetical protein
LESAFQRAGFVDVEVVTMSAPFHVPSAAECVLFLQEAAGAIHAMLAGLDDTAQQMAWDEMEQALKQFEGPGGFTSPCEVLIGVGVKN